MNIKKYDTLKYLLKETAAKCSHTPLGRTELTELTELEIYTRQKRKLLTKQNADFKIPTADKKPAKTDAQLLNAEFLCSKQS